MSLLIIIVIYGVILSLSARHFMKQILEGMLYLHSYGILHRDLTLANLLLSRDMDVVRYIVQTMN